MPEVKMTQENSGTRPDGSTWPPAGETITVSKEEAQQLIDSGQAEAVKDSRDDKDKAKPQEGGPPPASDQDGTPSGRTHTPAG
jgi:hypothetical protein